MSSVPPELPPGFEIPGQKELIAHATLMCIVFVLFLPIAALTTRSPLKARVSRVHAPWQIFNVVLAVTGMGLGITVARKRSIPVAATPHAILGFVIIGCLVVFQPALGVLQHRYFQKTSRRGAFGWVHLLLGRLLLILGLVNGARGFHLARDNKTAPYFAVLAVICTIYVAVLLWDWLQPKYKQRKASGEGDRMETDQNASPTGLEMNAQETRGANA